MLWRMTMIVVLSTLGLNLGYFSKTAQKSNDFDTLDNFEKDFFVAVGDAQSWKANQNIFESTGKPNGYICTRKSFSNYVLTLEFRYPAQAGNTGVLNYITGEHKIWPACVEVQGHYQNVAQIFAMGGIKGPRSEGDSVAREKSRKPHTDWNKLEITSKAGVISAKLNGVVISQSGPYPIRKGPIGLQSEGAPVHFRNIRIKEF